MAGIRVLNGLNSFESLGPDHWGLKAWNMHPAMAGLGTALGANGTVYVMKLYTPIRLSITNIHMFVSTAGDTLTAGQNFAGLFDSSKALLGTSVDQSTAWASTGWKTMVLAGAPFTVAPGYFYVAVFSNGTTRPTFARASNLGVVSAGLSAANAFWASADTGRTTSFPATLGAFAKFTNAFWAGVS